jgi:predicted RNA-binding Zn-ribbon protein involved in translation (DUF1610 family)
MGDKMKQCERCGAEMVETTVKGEWECPNCGYIDTDED